MANEATVKSREGKIVQPGIEHEYLKHNAAAFDYGKLRLRCMLNQPPKPLEHNGQPVDFGKMCLAVLDESVATQLQTSNSRDGALAPYHNIAELKGDSYIDVGIASAISRAVNAAVFRNKDAKPGDSANPIVATYTGKDGTGKTVKVYNGTALDDGYTMAFSYYQNNMLDRLKLDDSAATIPQSQLEVLANKCVANDKNTTYGVCQAVGAERFIRNIPNMEASVKKFRQGSGR